tara:strand:+ start:5274 stop:6650 length:1377 start_codon:yes stop_codon:yes gene_type:complete
MKIFSSLFLLILVFQTNNIIAQKAKISNFEIASAVIYEANIRQYSKGGTFSEFTKDLPVLKELGVKIIWLMPINPISSTKSKGPLGSYYAVSDYKKVNPEFGTEEDFRTLVKKAHDLGIYVILDWVPGHTGWDHIWIKEHPEFYLKNDKGEITDPINHTTGKSWGWTDVADLDYNNKRMKKAMSNAMKYWIEEFDIDGYRVDQAYAVPESFFNKTFKLLRSLKPIFLLAETDIEHPGGINLVSKFDASYHSGNYFLKQIAQGNMTVNEFENHLNSVLEKHKDENIILNYTSTHDVNSWQGTSEELYGNAYEMLTAFTYIFPGMPLLYCGQEYDLNKRLLFFEKDFFPKKKGKMITFLQKLGKLKNTNKALSTGTRGTDYHSLTGLVKMKYGKENQIFAFERSNSKNKVIFIANMSKNYAQFTMDYNGAFKTFSDGRLKHMSDSYEYVMKPWEFWILLN